MVFPVNLKTSHLRNSPYIQVFKMKPRHAILLLFALLSLLILACATSPTGRRQLMLVSEDSAIAASKQAFSIVNRKALIGRSHCNLCD